MTHWICFTLGSWWSSSVHDLRFDTIKKNRWVDFPRSIGNLFIRWIGRKWWWCENDKEKAQASKSEKEEKEKILLARYEALSFCVRSVE